MTPKILDAACKNVMHLCRLRRVLMERMVAGMGLYAGINYYIGSQRELSDEAYEGLVVTNHLIFVLSVSRNLHHVRPRKVDHQLVAVTSEL